MRLEMPRAATFCQTSKTTAPIKFFLREKKFLLACRVGDGENNAVDFSSSFFLKVGWPIQHNGERDKKAG